MVNSQCPEETVEFRLLFLAGNLRLPAREQLEEGPDGGNPVERDGNLKIKN